MNTNTQAPFANLFNAAREMIAERLDIIRSDKHGLYTQEDMESAEREQALIEQEIAAAHRLGFALSKKIA